jgi:hypothetical protein
MAHPVLALIVVLAWTADQEKLQFRNVQAAYGAVGPERKSLEYYPGDEILFRYVATGVRLNEKGEVDIDITIQVTNGEGQILLDRTTPTKAVAALGGGSLPGTARTTLSEAFKPGNYRLRVKAKDNLSGETASFQRDVTLKATEFTSISQRFFLDADGKVPSAAGGIVGQSLYYRLGVIGFDRSQGRVETHMDMEILDESGQETLTRPLKAAYKNDEAEAAKKVSLINFTGFIALNRVGNFTLRFNLTDTVGGQNSKFEVPLRVTEP